MKNPLKFIDITLKGDIEMNKDQLAKIAGLDTNSFVILPMKYQ